MISIPHRLGLQLVLAVACAALLALLVQDRNRWKSKTERYASLLAAERSAHSATVAGYRAAAEQARRADAENLARVKAEQAQINERTRDDFESRIAAARGRAGELRRQASGPPADPGRGAAAPVPGLPSAAEGAARAAGEDRLSQSERLIATEQAIQLDELIKWVRRQAGVDPDRD